MSYSRALIICAGLLVSAAVAAGPEDAIRASLGKAAPRLPINSIQPAPVPGIYEVMSGTRLLYVTEDGRYYIDGSIMDLKTGEDLTEPRMAEARKAAIEEIGDSEMVVFDPKDKDAEHTITVFTDIECGYCRKLHSQIGKYGDEGIRVRYLFYPRAGRPSKAYDEAVSVWCAGDADARRDALTAAKAGKSVKSKKCDNPVAEHMSVGEQLGLRGTPAIVTDTGEMIPGYVEPKRLGALLNASMTR